MGNDEFESPRSAALSIVAIVLLFVINVVQRLVRRLAGGREPMGPDPPRMGGRIACAFIQWCFCSCFTDREHYGEPEGIRRPGYGPLLLAGTPNFFVDECP